jgi:hypothetical protein
MKFRCDICGALFQDEKGCRIHENDCRTRHESALYITEELNILIGSANAQNLGLGLIVDGEHFQQLDSAKFAPDKNRITITLIPYVDESKKPDNKKR